MSTDAQFQAAGTFGRIAMFPKDKIRILLSAPACSNKIGSESLVGYRTTETLGRYFDSTVISSSCMEYPPNVAQRTVSTRFDDPNDISMRQLLQFERQQLRLIHSLNQKCCYHIFHRVTPSGWKPTLFSGTGFQKLVVGPILHSKSPPVAFNEVFFRNPLSSRFQKFTPNRILGSLARRNLEHNGQPILKNADLILAGSQVAMDVLEPELREKARYLTYSGVDHSFFRPESSEKKSSTFSLLFAGRLVSYKGVELLLKSVAVARKQRALTLKIVGRGTETANKYYQRLSHELGLQDCVAFMPQVCREELKLLYQRADVFCMPSVETYGIAILEAMSSGCTVLVADYNGPGEIVKPTTGWKVPLVSPEQFIDDYARRIIELSDSCQLRRELAETARAHIVDNHDWAKISSQLIDYYDELVADIRI